MQKAFVTKSTDEFDAVLALQAAEPGTARPLTVEEQAIAATILDAEDGYIVTTAEGGTPVWYLSDDETPRLTDSTEHTCWPGGQTWPRVGDHAPTAPLVKALAQAAEDWTHRHGDCPDPSEAADLAVVELLNDPSGWPRYVPDHWEPQVWVKLYRAAYAQAWV